ncbi:MAG TPA: hypothetical protein VLM85_17530 [Polyangiaceae bacterium]|nr:hypothetical protein [Polyangiaceae bacterium]
MRLSILACAFAMVMAGGVLACGGGTMEQTDGGDDAGADVVADDVMDASVAYPADHTPLPLVDYNGGRVIANPKVVTITFSNDDATMVTRLQQFGDTITSTPWWSSITAEYCQQPGSKPCIGPGTGGGHVVIADPPAASYTDSSQGGASSIQDFIKQHVTGTSTGDAGAGDAGDGGEGGAAAPDFPVPDDNTLYAIYFPAGVSIDLDGSGSCNTFGAYHNTVMLPNATNQLIPVAYAIIPRCDVKEAVTTVSASHEIAEAATDPDIGVGQVGYYMLNQLWAFAGGEVGDLCVSFTGNSDTVVESTFTVQRSWSNLSAKASHDPCVPIPSGDVYFNSAPRMQHIVLPKVGATAVIDIDAFSDAPTADWTLSAVDFAAFQGQTPQLGFSFDTTTANNGTHVQLTVTETSAISGGQDGFVILSTQGQMRHTWPVLVTTK